MKRPSLSRLAATAARLSRKERPWLESTQEAQEVSSTSGGTSERLGLAFAQYLQRPWSSCSRSRKSSPRSAMPSSDCGGCQRRLSSTKVVTKGDESGTRSPRRSKSVERTVRNSPLGSWLRLRKSRPLPPARRHASILACADRCPRKPC